ncbi:hypothetical protein [Paenibacillus paeoniae]|uniref:hypothetical protein n=1 Tax=Paenibacillus paeoniae TaxID=2292705 RepID=UPI0014021710|nr:hypothetical protein [Paenibacillus paeoniae]
MLFQAGLEKAGIAYRMDAIEPSGFKTHLATGQRGSTAIYCCFRLNSCREAVRI